MSLRFGQTIQALPRSHYKLVPLDAPLALYQSHYWSRTQRPSALFLIQVFSRRCARLSSAVAEIHEASSISHCRQNDDEIATGNVGFRETTGIEKGLTRSFPQADSALIPKAVVSSWVSFSRLHTRQPHAHSPGRSPAANRFSAFSTNDRCHRSIVDVWLARNACPGADCHKQVQSAGSRRVPRTCHAGKQGRHTRSPPDRASRRGQARYGRYSRQELPPLRL